MRSFLSLLNYYVIRICFFPVRFLSHKAIHGLGVVLGTIGYHVVSSHRKQTLNNIALAGMATSEQDMKDIAKESFQNLAITCLEYFRLSRSKKDLSNLIVGEQRENITELRDKGTGVIVLTSHQANWEMLFFDLVTHHESIAIGRPIKNPYLYEWIVSLREMNGGKIIEPKSSISQCISALQKGFFIGFVGDQSLPESSYSYQLFGVPAWTSSAPALLAYRTGCPIVVAELIRRDNRYHIRYHSPLWPDTSIPLRQEVHSLMDKATAIVEETVRKTPGQWLWQHRRWKQKPAKGLKKRYRFDTILVIMESPLDEQLATIRSIYPQALFFVMMPEQYKELAIPLDGVEYLWSQDLSEIFVRDWRFQLIFHSTPYHRKIKSHFLRLGAHRVVHFDQDAKIRHMLLH